MGNWQAGGYEIAGLAEAYRAAASGNYAIAGAALARLPGLQGLPGLNQGNMRAQPIGGFGAGPGSVVQQTPMNVKGSVVGLDSVSTILATASATVTTTPQETFRPERFFVADSIAAFFNITDVKIGAKSQLVNSSNIPAEMFMSTATDVSLKFDTCLAGQTISVNVTNVDPAAAAHRFLGGFAGTAAI